VGIQLTSTKLRVATNFPKCRTKLCTYLVGDLGSLGSLSGLGKEDEGDREDQKRRDDESLQGNHDAWYASSAARGGCGVK
jgi:hypothetical protein